MNYIHRVYALNPNEISAFVRTTLYLVRSEQQPLCTKWKCLRYIKQNRIIRTLYMPKVSYLLGFIMNPRLSGSFMVDHAKNFRSGFPPGVAGRGQEILHGFTSIYLREIGNTCVTHKRRYSRSHFPSLCVCIFRSTF